MQNDLYHENLFNRIMNRVFDVVSVGIISLLCCIPVITISTSLSAMYKVMIKIVKDEDAENIRTFFRFFKENLKQGILYSLIYVVSLLVLASDMFIFRGGEGIFQVFYGICLAAVFADIAIFAYVFPLLSAFDNTVRGTLNNAWRLALINWKTTIVVTAVSMAPFLWFYFSPDSFAPFFWPVILIYPGLSGYLNSIFIYRIIDRLKERTA